MQSLLPFVFLLIFCTAALSSGVDKSAELSDRNFDFDQQLQHFQDANAVNEFRQCLKNGLLGKDEQFNMRDPKIRAETIAIVDLLFSVRDSDTLEQLLEWLRDKTNYEQFMHFSTVFRLMQNRFPEVKGDELLPVWYATHPNYFVPDHILRRVKSDIERGTYNASEAPLIVPDPSDSTAYFREDPDLNRMFYNWNMYFPLWADPKKYGLDRGLPNRGEVIYDFHHLLSTAFYLRSGTRKTPWLVQWEQPLEEGYDTELVNSAGKPFSSRMKSQPKVDNVYHQKLKEVASKIRDILEEEKIYMNVSYSMPINSSEVSKMVSILSDIVYNTTSSINTNYYGSFYEAAVNYLSSLGSEPDKDGGGLAGHPLTALRDPAFYQVLTYINAVVEYYKKTKSKNYGHEKIADEDLRLMSINVDRLQTYFEPIDIDLRGWLDLNSEPEGKYVIRQLRLNHEPFVMTINLTNIGQVKKDALISVFLAKDFYRHLFDEDYFQPIDSFKIVAYPGNNIVERKISDSKIFSEDEPSMIPCGIPKTLILPKGTEEGHRMSLFAIITRYNGSTDDETTGKQSKKSPLCGNIRLNHGRSFSFPIDRPLHADISHWEGFFLS